MSAMSTEFDLERFVAAQDPVYRDVLAELRAGKKRGHWMWFIFPQLRGLGRSAMAWTYGLPSLAAATAYLAHPVLGARLVECAQLVNAIQGQTAHEIFGSPDDLKFHSSMTLFAHVPQADLAFAWAIERYFSGVYDRLTLELLG